MCTECMNFMAAIITAVYFTAVVYAADAQLMHGPAVLTHMHAQCVGENIIKSAGYEISSVWECAYYRLAAATAEVKSQRQI